MRLVWHALVPLGLVVLAVVLCAGATICLNSRKRAAEQEAMKEGK